MSESAVFKQVLSRLQKTKPPNASGNVVAICPYHDDNERSFSVHPEKGGICFNPACEAAKGVSLNDLAVHLGIKPPNTGKPIIEKTYDYIDESGAIAFQVVRMKPKSFRQRHKNRAGDWVWNMNGVKYTLYNLPGILGDKNDSWVFLCEGEKDADNVISIGLVGTTNPQGAGKWRNEYTDILKNKKVVILRDNDNAGEEHARKVASEIYETSNDVRVVLLPDLPPKGDVTDWIKAGGTPEKLLEIVNQTESWEPPEIEDDEHKMIKIRHQYKIDGGELCVIKTSKDYGRFLSPLCSGVPEIIEEIIRDDGVNETREYAVIATTANGIELPRAEVQVSEFANMNWMDKVWGTKMDITPGTTNAQHIRSYMKRQVNGNTSRRIYTHTGWREVDGERVFLSASGALMNPSIEVDLRDRLAQYRLPTKIDAIDKIEAIKTSFSFIEDGFGKDSIMYSLFAAMYGAPLSTIIDPAFTLFLHGHSGSFKSVISALAISHFGKFTYTTMPASWEYTANRLGLEMFICKDIPLVIDDWAPGATIAAQKEMENKIAIVLRAQGNKIGRGRLNPDSTAKDSYTPRGLVVTSGEQLPSGESNTARMFVLDIEPGDISVPMLNIAQSESDKYRYSMAYYILWVADNWGTLSKVIKDVWIESRDTAIDAGLHLRLPASVAWLYTGMSMALDFSLDNKAMKDSEYKEIKNHCWSVLCDLAKRQGARVDDERPAIRFVEAFKSLLTQGRLVVIDKSYDGLNDICDPETREPLPRQLKTGETFIGWDDPEFFYLIPKIAYQLISEFYNKSGQPLTFKPSAVWGDLKRTKLTDCTGDRDNAVVKIGNSTQRVIKLRKSAVYSNK